MDYHKFINTTYSHDTFKIITTNNNGTCCYDSILKLLKVHKLIQPNINTKTIQAQAVNWIIKNKNLYLSNYSLTLEELVLYTHQLDSFDNYISLYKIYSGKSVSNIQNRWGGTPELIALSNIYNIIINVYTGKSYNKKTNKIIKGTVINNKPRKDFRYKLILNTEDLIYNNLKSRQIINILYSLHKNITHFDALI